MKNHYNQNCSWCLTFFQKKQGGPFIRDISVLGLTIDNKLNFGIHINNMCKVASAKIKGLGRIKSRLNLS